MEINIINHMFKNHISKHINSHIIVYGIEQLKMITSTEVIIEVNIVAKEDEEIIINININNNKIIKIRIIMKTMQKRKKRNNNVININQRKTQKDFKNTNMKKIKIGKMMKGMRKTKMKIMNKKIKEERINNNINRKIYI